MPRYQFSIGGRTIIIGWDNPLHSFFAQVWNGDPNAEGNINTENSDVEPEPELWIGQNSHEVLTVEALAAQLQPYATIPDEIQTLLHADSAERHPPTDFQNHLG